MSATWKKEDFHRAFVQHIGHEIYISTTQDHETYTWCRTCLPDDERGFLFFKTWNTGSAVAFVLPG